MCCVAAGPRCLGRRRNPIIFHGRNFNRACGSIWPPRPLIEGQTVITEGLPINRGEAGCADDIGNRTIGTGRNSIGADSLRPFDKCETVHQIGLKQGSRKALAGFDQQVLHMPLRQGRQRRGQIGTAGLALWHDNPTRGRLVGVIGARCSFLTIATAVTAMYVPIFKLNAIS